MSRSARGLDAAVEAVLEIGPANRALEGQPAEVRDAAKNSIRETLAPFVSGQEVPACRIDLDRDREGFLRDAELVTVSR